MTEDPAFPESKRFLWKWPETTEGVQTWWLLFLGPWLQIQFRLLIDPEWGSVAENVLKMDYREAELTIFTHKLGFHRLSIAWRWR